MVLPPVPELAKGSMALANGSLPNPGNGSTLGLLAPVGKGLFDLGGAGRGGGCFLDLGGRAGACPGESVLFEDFGAKGSVPNISSLPPFWKVKTNDLNVY